MIRKVNKTVVDYGKELNVIIIQSDKSSKDTIEARNSLIEMMRDIVQDPALIILDALTPDSVKFEHDGERWILKVSVIKNVQTEKATPGSTPVGT